MIRLDLLGTVQLSVIPADGSTTLAPVTQPKPLALLAYLAAAIPGGFRRRDELLGLFWPELDATRGRRALSQALFVLRTAVGSDVVISRGTEEVALDWDVFSSDVVAFRAAVAAERWNEAMTLYRGDFLTGFFLSDAPEFEQWVERERAALRARAVSTAWAIADREERTGSTSAALDWARRATELAPYDETGTRRLLELLDRAGDRAGAIRVYNAYATRLERDLSVEPSAETRAAIQAIRERLDVLPRVEPKAESAPRDAVVTPAAEAAGPVEARSFARPRPTLFASAIAGVAVIVIIAGAAAARQHSPGALNEQRSVTDPPHRERILITDFAHTPADSDVATAITEAIRLDLSQSPNISLMSWSAVRGVLRRMQRDSARSLDSTLAREVALREGVKAVLEGEVLRSGTNYVLGARIVSADSGQLIEGWRETAHDSTEILSAIDRLSRSIRRHIGESVQSIRDRPHPLRVATTSLDALLKHGTAIRAFYAGEYERAAALQEEALRLDPTFADAWISLSIALTTMGVHPARQIEAIIKAYSLRDRLPDWERYEVEGHYAMRVRGDLLTAITAFHNQTELEPVDGFWAPIGNMLNQLGRYEEAERTMMRANQLGPTPYTFYALAVAQWGQHRDSLAMSTIESGLARFPRFPALEISRANIAIARGQYSRADSLIHTFAARGTDQFPLVQQTDIDAMRGKLSEAEDHLRALARVREERGLFAESIETAILLGRLRLDVIGDTAGAIHGVDSALARHPLAQMDARERPYARLARLYLGAGQTERAANILAEYDATVPREYRAADTWLVLRTRAQLRLARGERAEGLAELRGAERGTSPLAAIAELAQAYEFSAQPDSSLAAYDRYLTVPHLSRVEDDGLHLARVFERIGALSAARGDTARAIASYERLLKLWDHADASVQGRRRDVMRRVDLLRARGRR